MSGVSNFQQARIALLETRMGHEMVDLMRRRGGNPYSIPSVREQPIENKETVSALIDHLAQHSIQIAIFLTGVGVKALFHEAEQLERLPELLTALHNITIVCRGPKPAAALKRYEIPVNISAQEPYTTQQLLQALGTVELKDKGIAVVHYGERSTAFTQALHARGATLEELCLYEWQLPEDITPLRTLVHDVIAQRVDAVVFTSQVQARHLFAVATDMQLASALSTALNKDTLVASIGPTCTDALLSYGVTPHIIPEHPKMGHLVNALIERMA
ncbi:MAG TPA: uroporphyrinogen-III synthase [Ktedonobacteraceae bacterium]|jgi:uroporphyrinogen-III synthase